MALRYAFKAEANRWARDFRKELGLDPEDPLCPWELCELLGISVFPISSFRELHPKEVAYFLSGKGAKDLSAVAIGLGLKKLIIHNDAHNRKRQASNISHETAHIVLHHPLSPMLGSDNRRSYDKDQEDEAAWLGPALLISDEAALFIVEQRMSLQEASRYYRVSQELVQMRINGKRCPQATAASAASADLNRHGMRSSMSRLGCA